MVRVVVDARILFVGRNTLRLAKATSIEVAFVIDGSKEQVDATEPPRPALQELKYTDSYSHVWAFAERSEGPSRYATVRFDGPGHGFIPDVEGIGMHLPEMEEFASLDALMQAQNMAEVSALYGASESILSVWATKVLSLEETSLARSLQESGVEDLEMDRVISQLSQDPRLLFLDHAIEYQTWLTIREVTDSMVESDHPPAR